MVQAGDAVVLRVGWSLIWVNTQEQGRRLVVQLLADLLAYPLPFPAQRRQFRGGEVYRPDHSGQIVGYLPAFVGCALARVENRGDEGLSQAFLLVLAHAGADAVVERRLAAREF